MAIEARSDHFDASGVSFPQIFQQHFVQSDSIYGNTVYELITETERTNQKGRNAISKVENLIDRVI